MNGYPQLQEVLEDIVADIRANLESTGTNASGRTSASLAVEMTDNGGMISGRQYFRGVETGRPAGPVPHNFVQIIRAWMAAKGITAPAIEYKRRESERWKPKYTPAERGAMAMAGAIAHKIRTEGTRLYRQGGRTDIYTSAIEEHMDALIMASMGGTITTLNDEIGRVLDEKQ